MTTLSEEIVRIQSQVFREKYYVQQYLDALVKCNMSTATIDQHEHEDHELVLLMQTFWEALPDTPAIRTGPFFKICDVAEKIFDLPTREVFVLLTDGDGTMRSTDRPFGVAVTSEDEAKAFVARGGVGYSHSYTKVRIFDSSADAVEWAYKK
jgi:hypothetical protein